MYEYEDIPRDIHPGVKQAIKDFKSLPQEEKERKPLLYWLLKSGTPKYKMSKEDSEYSEGRSPNGKLCKDCEFFYKKVTRDEFICSKVRGDISPGGFCKLYLPPKITKESDYGVTHSAPPGYTI